MKIPLCLHALSAQSSFKRSSMTVVEALKSLLLTRNPSLLVLKVYGKANFLKMLTHVDHGNLRPVLLQTRNRYLPFLSISQVQNSSFPPFHGFFEKSSNYSTKFVYFLTKKIGLLLPFLFMDKERRFHFQLSFNYALSCLLYF